MQGDQQSVIELALQSSNFLELLTSDGPPYIATQVCHSMLLVALHWQQVE